MAIAFDASANATGLFAVTSLTWSHTCTGSDRLLLVATIANDTAANDYVTGATYGGVAMTEIGTGLSPVSSADNRWLHLFYLLAPASGANNVVVSASSATFIDGSSASYTGVRQSAQPDNTATSNSGAVTSETTSLTTVADNCWVMLAFDGYDAGNQVAAGASTTRRVVDAEYGHLAIFDTNGAVTPAGSRSLTSVTSGSLVHAHIMASFAPAVTVSGGATATINIQAYLSGAWVTLNDDVIESMGLTLKYGIDGNGPTDVVASPGEVKFGLRNDAGCSGGVIGYYSPQHASKRTGWGFGVPVRVRFSSTAASITDKVKFYGKIRVIDPLPGQYDKRPVSVIGVDGIADLLDADVRALAIATATDEASLIDDVLDAVPSASQPLARSLDTGAELFPVAFDDLSGGTKALALIRDLTLSALGRFVINGAGTARYINRHNWGPLNTNDATLSNTMTELEAPNSFDRCVNRVRVTTHRKTTTATATDLLYDLPAGGMLIGPGETREVWCDYTDPNDRQTKVGGVGVVTTLVSGTHYAGNASEDGLGTDLSADLTVTLTAFSSTGKFSVENTGTAGIWVSLKIYGRAIRNLGATVSEAYSVQSYGDRVVDLDLPYQDSAYRGQEIADYIEGVYSTLTNQVDTVTFCANRSATLMGYALNVEPGDQVTLTETVTGLTSVECVVQSVEISVLPNVIIMCRWRLSPASTLAVPWVLGTDGLGDTTDLGF